MSSKMAAYLTLLTLLGVFCGRSEAGASLYAVGDCVLKPVPNNEFKFQFTTYGFLKHVKDCEPDTIFSAAACGCVSLLAARGGPTTPPPPPPTTTAVTPDNCEFRPDPKEIFRYLEKTNQGWLSRKCSNGAVFELAPSCACVHYDLVQPTCSPDIDIDVNDKGEMNAYGGMNRQYTVPIITKNVHSDETGIVFNETSALSINTLSGVDFGNGLTLSFEFREDAPVSSPAQVLLANCNQTLNKFSIEVSIENNYVAFRLDVGDDRYFRRDVEYKSTGFKKVMATYDGATFTGSVDGVEGKMLLDGAIQPVNAPMVVGNTLCSDVQGFKGKIRNLQLYRCVKSMP